MKTMTSFLFNYLLVTCLYAGARYDLAALWFPVTALETAVFIFCVINVGFRFHRLDIDKPVKDLNIVEITIILIAKTIILACLFVFDFSLVLQLICFFNIVAIWYMKMKEITN